MLSDPESRARALEKLVEALEPFRSGGDWGKWKAWLVEGTRVLDGKSERGLDAAQLITHWQVAVDAALASLPDPKAPEEGEKSWLLERKIYGCVSMVCAHRGSPNSDGECWECLKLARAVAAALSAPERPAGGGEKGAGMERALKELLRDSDDALSQAHSAIREAAEIIRGTRSAQDLYDWLASPVVKAAAVVTALKERT